METMLVRKLHLSWKLTWRGGKSQPFANTFPPNPAMWEKTRCGAFQKRGKPTRSRWSVKAIPTLIYTTNLLNLQNVRCLNPLFCWKTVCLSPNLLPNPPFQGVQASGHHCTAGTRASETTGAGGAAARAGGSAVKLWDIHGISTEKHRKTSNLPFECRFLDQNCVFFGIKHVNLWDIIKKGVHEQKVHHGK